MNKPRVSVVGATGLVGREIVTLLEQRRFPLSQLTLYSSQRSAGEEVEYAGEEHTVKALDREDFLDNTDIALCSAGRKVSYLLKEWVTGTSVVAIDNSSAFRMDPDVPLVVPEVNPEAVKGHSGYIANPNCSTIQLAVVLAPLHEKFGLERVIVSTYQSVSGAGQKGVAELSTQAMALFNQQQFEISCFPHRIAFNLIPQIGGFEDNGYTEEEMKVINETGKILGLPDLGISCTAVRVPVFTCHAEAVTVQFARDAQVPGVVAVLEESPGIVVKDDPAYGVYPMPIDAGETDAVFVGRVRRDLSGPRSFNMWIVADNLWKGAALNAVQIAELLLKP